MDATERKEVNGTHYTADTPDGVIEALEAARRARTRIVVGYRAESFPEVGRVSRTTGDLREPILVHNERSLGGYPVWTAGIVEIRESATKRLLYKAAT